MNKQTFDAFRALVYAQSGITLSEAKQALVESRLGKRMRQLGIDSYEAYLECLRADANGDELVCFLDAISTNVTSFFREPDHFALLAERLSEWQAQGQRRFRLWSAACSSGEEPYSIAMTASDTLRGAGLDLRILATDISTKVLQKAQQGCYPAKALETVPPELAQRYFQLHSRSGGDEVQEIVPELRQLILFRRLNLSAPPFPMKGPFDAVFCRNVMIYFDHAVRGRLLDEIFRLLRPGGLLMVGHTESLAGIQTPFKLVRPSVYRKASDTATGLSTAHRETA